MRTRLKHAENGAKSGKPECPNQSQNILSRLSPQKGDDGGVLLRIVKEQHHPKLLLKAKLWDG